LASTMDVKMVSVSHGSPVQITRRDDFRFGARFFRCWH
jgi:hypothetical protein